MFVDINHYITNNWDEIRLKVLKVCRNHQNTDDLLSDLYISLMEKNNDIHESLLKNNKVQHWFTYSAYVQFNSSTSPFYKKYIKFNKTTSDLLEWKDSEVVDDNDVKLEKLQILDDVINDLDYYDKEITNRILLKGETQTSVSQYFDINRKYISNDLKRIKKELKEKVVLRWNK